MTAEALIEFYGLQPHPEGGFYRETYRSSETISQHALPPRFKGDRNCYTAIFFLLAGDNFSAFHRIQSDEVWHFYSGIALNIHIIGPDGKAGLVRLGNDPANGEVFQSMVPAGSWFASEPSNRNGYCLVGCTVSPGFDFADFEMAKQEELIKDYPQHEALIKRLCRI